MRSDEPDRPSRRKVLRLSLGLLVLPGLTLPGIARAAPLRVVTLFQGASDTAVALGVTPCGVVDSWSEKPMYRYLRPALAAVPHVGLETQPSLEDIVLLKPDLIVASRFRHQRIAPLLEQIAPLVMLEEVFEFKLTLAMMGAALNRQQQAMALLGQWQQRVTTLREQLKARFAGRWPITVSVLDVREDHIRSYLPASFAGSVLSELGFDWTPAAREAQGVSSNSAVKRVCLWSMPTCSLSFSVATARPRRTHTKSWCSIRSGNSCEHRRTARSGESMRWPGACPAEFWAPT